VRDFGGHLEAIYGVAPDLTWKTGLEIAHSVPSRDLILGVRMLPRMLSITDKCLNECRNKPKNEQQTCLIACIEAHQRAQSLGR
jgi:hypothetical protein